MADATKIGVADATKMGVANARVANATQPLDHPVGVDKLSHLSLQLHHVVNCDPSALEVELDWRPSTLLDNSLTETIAQARGELVQHKWRLMSLDGRSQQLQHDKDLLE